MGDKSLSGRYGSQMTTAPERGLESGSVNPPAMSEAPSLMLQTPPPDHRCGSALQQLLEDKPAQSSRCAGYQHLHAVFPLGWTGEPARTTRNLRT